MTITDLAGALTQLLAPERVLAGGPATSYSVDGIQPSFVLRPDSISEISAILHFAAERRLAVAPFGGVTQMQLGNKPSRLDLALDLRALNAIVDFSPEDLVVTTQAGVTVEALNNVLAVRGQFLALDVPLPQAATVGGSLSAGIVGPRRLRYGTARDLVIGLTCVLAGGEVVHSGGRVVKNVAGYDLNKLYLGALGTLGVIVEATFKLHPAAAASTALTAVFPDRHGAFDAAMQLVNSNLGPTAVEICDPSLAQDWLGRPNSSWSLALLTSGLPESVARQRREMAEIVRSAGAARIDQEESGAEPGIFRRICDLGYSAGREAALLLRCAVTPSQIAAAAAELDGALQASPPAVLASPGSGLLRLFWRELPPDPAAALAAARTAIGRLLGTVTVERCPAELKSAVEVWGIAGPDIALMHDLKAAFDPNAILNPGRYVDRI